MVEVRELHEMAEFEQVDALFGDIWHFGTGAPPITVELMRALAHAGGYVAGAFDGGRLLGGSVGFLAGGNALHSRVTGTAAGRGIGFALADVGGRPVTGPVDAGTVLVAVPADIGGLRGADPGTAKAWRHAVRDVLGGLMAEGRAVTGFSGKSYYVVETK
ncbi:hypothetical protein ACIBI9_35290 [Nonomuraea sp. NPDC050451]|uniref:hypothetical protein n=1 Tax=Nonomuraea sp. NPDC050451 TaxID=3364364 RepID=UPI0037A6A19B